VAHILKQSTSSWRFYSSYHNNVRNHEPEISNTSALDFGLIWCDAMLLGKFPTFQGCYSPTKCWELPAQQQSDQFQKTWICSNTAVRTSNLIHSLLCMLLPLSENELKLKMGQCVI